MPIVKLDQVEGASYRRRASGDELVRVAHVQGLPGGQADRLRHAVAASGLPRVGAAHPHIQGLAVDELHAEPDGLDAAVVRIVYRPVAARGPSRQAAGVELTSRLTSERTATDLAGRTISVSYSATGDADDLDTKTQTLSVLRPSLTLRFTRREAVLPGPAVRRFIGAINRTPVFDSGAGTWLCTAIEAQPDSEGDVAPSREPVGYVVAYTFAHRAPGWQPVVEYIDDRTNRPPADLVDGVGRKRVRLYPQLPFEELHLA